MTYPTPDAAGSETPDFTVNRDPHCFTIAPDRFCAPAIISSVALRNLATMHAAWSSAAGSAPVVLADGRQETDADRSVNLICDMFQLLLPGRDGVRFAERARSDGHPGDHEAGIPASPPVIDIAREATPALNWLMERYGLRPTEPSSPSLDGSTDGQTNTPSDTTSSTDGALPEASASAS